MVMLGCIQIYHISDPVSDRLNLERRTVFQIIFSLHLHHELHLVGEYHCKLQHSYANI